MPEVLHLIGLAYDPTDRYRPVRTDDKHREPEAQNLKVSSSRFPGRKFERRNLLVSLFELLDRKIDF